MKNRHAVALGRLGGAKGGAARAAALTPTRRREIARAAGLARVKRLTPAERQNLARKAARARWGPKGLGASVALSEAPTSVRRLLQSYDPAKLSWSRTSTRYMVVREILVRGDARARQWLRSLLGEAEVRDLVRRYKGAGCNEPARTKLRKTLRLTVEDLPVRPYLGFE